MQYMSWYLKRYAFSVFLKLPQLTHRRQRTPVCHFGWVWCSQCWGLVSHGHIVLPHNWLFSLVCWCQSFPYRHYSCTLSWYSTISIKAEGFNKVKYTWICIMRLRATPLMCSDIDHTVLPAKNTISAFTPSRISSPPFGRYSLRLSTEGWPGWVECKTASVLLLVPTFGMVCWRMWPPLHPCRCSDTAWRQFCSAAAIRTYVLSELCLPSLTVVLAVFFIQSTLKNSMMMMMMMITQCCLSHCSSDFPAFPQP